MCVNMKCIYALEYLNNKNKPVQILISPHNNNNYTDLSQIISLFPVR